MSQVDCPLKESGSYYPALLGKCQRCTFQQFGFPLLDQVPVHAKSQGNFYDRFVATKRSQCYLCLELS